MSVCSECDGNGYVELDHCNNPECQTKPVKLECDGCGGSGTICDRCSEQSWRGENVCRDCVAILKEESCTQTV